MPHYIECPQCSGEGFTWHDDMKRGEHVTVETKCDRCDGDGKAECDEECEECAHEKQEAAIRAEMLTTYLRRDARRMMHALADYEKYVMTPAQTAAFRVAYAALAALEVA